MTKKLLTILFLLGACLYAQKAEATAYYVDETSGTACGQTGLATTTPFCVLDNFTENARSAGDIAFVRRNISTTTTRSTMGDLNFTSDGTIANPIIISADNDNLWNDASTTAQTYTVAVATSTLVANTTITGVSAGTWFYVVGDCTQTYNSTVLNQCEYFYEVATVQGNLITLHTPYKGNQTGAGNSLVLLGANPQWNIESGNFQWNFDTDNYWLVKGMDIRGTSVNGKIEIDSSLGHNFIDSIFTGDGVTTSCFVRTDDVFLLILDKIRCFNNVASFGRNSTVDSWGRVFIRDSIFDGNNVASSFFGQNGGVTFSSIQFFVYDTISRNQNTGDYSSEGSTDNFFRNVSFQSTTEFISDATGVASSYFEDFDGVIGQNTYRSSINGTNENLIIASSTTQTVRPGGGPVSVSIAPTTNTTSKWDFNKIKLFEYPIYTDTISKQYDVYFMSTSTTNWTTDPTATELWIECEYWAHDTNATSTRKIKKSGGTIDFNGTTAWQALSVTCQPTQTGILYLRGWYAKTKESVSNYFFVDGTPVIQ